VFTTSTGKSTKVLYAYLIEDMLKYAGLRDGPSGIPRSTYCFRIPMRLAPASQRSG
jgi:integrase